MGVAFLLLLLPCLSCYSASSVPRLQPPPPLLPPGGGGDHLPYHQQNQQQNHHSYQPIPHQYEPGISSQKRIELNQYRPNSGNPGWRDRLDLQEDDRDGLASGILEGDLWEDDAGWWDGADEIDLTQSSLHYQDQYLFHPGSVDFDQDWYVQNIGSNEEDYFGLPDCGDFAQDEADDFCDVAQVTPPPPKLLLPPPPIPPFLPGLTHLAQSQRMQALSSILPPDEGHCVLCHWAEHGNASTTLFALDSDPDGGLAGLLAGVAVGSAVTGAILTAMLIRCRRSKILPTVKDSCPVLPRGSWSTSAGDRANAVPKPPSAGHTTAPVEVITPVSTGTGDTTTRTGWAMKLWRRGSSQERPLRPASSYSSENSYTEEPYVNPEGQSSLYAELASGLNTYAEIPDPGRPPPQMVHPIPGPGRPPPQMVHPNFVAGVSDYGYGNSAYALSEAPSEPAESSSTPSSAYYSDVSTDAHANKKKRKKKKGNEREFIMSTGCSFGMMPTNISSTVPIMTARLEESIHPLSSGELCRGGLTQEVLPMPVRFLPRSYSLERQGVTYSCTPCHACTPISTLPIMRHACELSAVVLSPAHQAVITHHLSPCAGDPSIKFAAHASVGQVFHGSRAPDIANTSMGQVFHGTRASGVQTVNTVTCSAHAGGGPIMSHNPQLLCRQEQPIPCPPSEYV